MITTVCRELVIITIMFCAGGYDGNILDSILEFNSESEQWKEIGKLRLKRAFHAASVININKIAAYLDCD